MVARLTVQDYLKNSAGSYNLAPANGVTTTPTYNYYTIQTPSEPSIDTNMSMIILGLTAMVMISAIAIVALSKKR